MQSSSNHLQGIGCLIMLLGMVIPVVSLFLGVRGIWAVYLTWGGFGFLVLVGLILLAEGLGASSFIEKHLKGE